MAFIAAIILSSVLVEALLLEEICSDHKRTVMTVTFLESDSNHRVPKTFIFNLSFYSIYRRPLTIRFLEILNVEIGAPKF